MQSLMLACFIRKKEGKIGLICLWVDGIVACGAANVSVAGKKSSKDKPDKWS